MAQTRLDVYQLEPSSTNGQVIKTVGGVATWAADSSGLASADLIWNEDFTSSANGTASTFTLANTPESGTVRVHLDGLRLREGAANDFSVTGTTLTMQDTPASGQTVIVDYLVQQ